MVSTRPLPPSNPDHVPNLANDPQPRAREAHPAGYAYEARFPALRRYAEAEGGAVYIADVPDGFYVVIDERVLAEFLDDDDPGVTLYAFDTAVDRDAYCAHRFARTGAVADGARRADAPIVSGHPASLRLAPNVPTDVHLSFKGRRVVDFADLLRAYGDAELDAPTRSTVPLLAWWRSADDALSALATAVGRPVSQPVSLAFEYPVPVQGDGQGAASQTDLLVSTPTQAIAIEAKSTEPAYQTVDAWLGGRGEDSNRGRVLRGWLGVIREAAGVALTPADVADVTYQLIHRTASACHVRAEWRAVVYQGFGLRTPEREAYVEQIRRLYALLGRPPQLRFFVFDCPIHPTAAYADLRTRWAAGERHLAGAVRDGLVRGALLEHGPCGPCAVTSA